MNDHRGATWIRKGHWAAAAVLALGGILAHESLSAQLRTSGVSTITREVTFAGDVARIMQENCQVCHRPGGIGPMSFTSYEEIRPWAPLIREKVATGQMPPYAYDRDVGIQELKGDWRLSEEEIATIVAWADQGALLGNPADLPPPIELPDPTEWRFAGEFGPPDVVVGVPAIAVPANGNDMWYRPLVPTNWTEDRCIKAIQVKPAASDGAASVVHHANTTFQVPGADAADDPDSDDNLSGAGRLSEYAMGKYGELIPEGTCRRFPANAYISWDIHLFPGGVGGAAQGKPIEGNVVEVGIWFHPADYQGQYRQDLRQYTAQQQGELLLPPHGTTMTMAYHTFDHPVRIDSFQPHGHLRLRHAALEILYPETGRTEVVSMISNWSATWHHSHIYEDDVAPLLPTGAVLIVKQWYDNTADNPNNPDPDQWVAGGSRTGDEMSHAWIAITHLDEEGYQRILAERQAREDRVAQVGN